MKHTLALSALALLLTVGTNAQTITAAPATMNFQGRLAKKDGTPVADGTHTLTFRIYDAPTGGNVRWAEQIGSLTTRNGVFAATLGKVFPFSDTILNGNVWLEITVDTDAPLIPRQQFQSVAYALKANTVPDGAITTAKIADGAITALKLASGVSGFPSGYKILGDTTTAPTGFAFSGETITTGGTWRTQTPLPQPRTAAFSATVNGKVYIIGGYSSNDITNNTTYVYDPATGIWSTRTPMPTARAGATCAVVNGKIHVLGGYTPSSYLSVHEVYDPITDSWTTRASIPATLYIAGCIAYNNQIFVIGGSNSGVAVATNYVYDDNTNTWTMKMPMPTARAAFATTIIGQNVYAVGGLLDPSAGSVCANNEVYNIATDTWATKSPLPRAYLTIPISTRGLSPQE